MHPQRRVILAGRDLQLANLCWLSFIGCVFLLLAVFPITSVACSSKGCVEGKREVAAGRPPFVGCTLHEERYIMSWGC
jgi:hypothetical protein